MTALDLVIPRVLVGSLGMDAAYVAGFVRRHRLELEAMALEAGLDGLARFLEEHRIARLLLDAARSWLAAPGPGGEEIAAMLGGILEHARFEEAVLFPIARELGIETGYVEAEHAHAEVWVEELAAAIRAKRGYEGPVFAGLIHHFEDEERSFAGLRGAPWGGESWLIAWRGRIEALAGRLRR